MPQINQTLPFRPLLSTRSSPLYQFQRREFLTHKQVFIRQFSFPFKGDPMGYSSTEAFVSNPLISKYLSPFRIFCKVMSYIPGAGLITSLCCGPCKLYLNSKISLLYPSQREQKAVKARRILQSIGLGFLLLPVDLIGTIIKAIDMLKHKKRAKQEKETQFDPSIVL